MKAYTDYPLQTNPNSEVVEIEVFSYDRNKYCTVRHAGEEEEIKAGYVWRDPKLTKRFSNLCWLQLPVKPWNKAPSRLQVFAEYKRIYRSKKVSYTLYNGSEDHYYNTLSDALKAFSRVKGDCYLFADTVGGFGWSARMILSREKGHLFVASDNRRPALKSRHLKKHKITYYK